VSDKLEVNVKKTKTKTWTERVCDEIVTQLSIECNTVRTYYRDLHPSDLLVFEYKASHKKIFLHFLRCLGKAAKKMNDNLLKDMFNGVINFILSFDDESHTNYGVKLYKGLFPHLA